MNKFQKIFDAQKALFATGVTRTYEWRVEQLDRMARMINENERALPGGDGQRLQNRLARVHLRDRRVGGRDRGPEEPVEGVDEAGRSAGAELPRQDWPQGNDLSRAVRRRADHRPLQRTVAPADPPRAGGARGRQYLHSHAKRSAAGNDRSVCSSWSRNISIRAP